MFELERAVEEVEIADMSMDLSSFPSNPVNRGARGVARQVVCARLDYDSLDVFWDVV